MIKIFLKDIEALIYESFVLFVYFFGNFINFFLVLPFCLISLTVKDVVFDLFLMASIAKAKSHTISFILTQLIIILSPRNDKQSYVHKK